MKILLVLALTLTLPAHAERLTDKRDRNTYTYTMTGLINGTTPIQITGLPSKHECERVSGIIELKTAGQFDSICTKSVYKFAEE